MAQNGLGGNNAAVYSGMNGSIMPSAGHYSDMQTLMNHMETLSGWLQQNREEWSQLQEGLARVERLNGRSPREGQQPQLTNGNVQSEQQQQQPQEPTNIQLQTALARAEERINSLERTHESHLRLQQLYEETLSEATERIRQYCFEQQNHTIALHQHYTSLLSQSRNETIEAQLTHQAWQAGLQRMSEGVRAAFKAREEERRPWLGKIQALKEENQTLRRMAGWEPVEDSDEEDEEDGEGGGGQRDAPERGRSGGYGR